MDENKLLAWLLDSDPAIRWQVLRDIVHTEEASWAAERARVATHGWGGRLLSYQDKSGQWGKSLHNNKWVSTTYSLLLLHRMGLPQDNPRAARGCQALFEGGYQQDGVIRFSKKTDVIDNSINGIVLTLLSYFAYPDERVHTIAEYLLGQQKKNGRWEPYPENEKLKYTLAATLLILSGLRQYEQQYPERAAEAAAAAQERGREFLLSHHLYKEIDSDEVISKKTTLFSFPPRWKYDVLTALDYFQACSTPHDPRMKDAIKLLKEKRHKNGSWNLQNQHVGKSFFEMEEVGSPSRWNTLRAMRVLNWWKAQKHYEGQEDDVEFKE